MSQTAPPLAANQRDLFKALDSAIVDDNNTEVLKICDKRKY
jgi:hypothetical protein